ncbi:MAG: type II secretion system protein [Candidatus Kaiserbacteria bacterium]|nr:type II secretion system protein [Candidatus Kaiserbacteria bacterium]
MTSARFHVAGGFTLIEVLISVAIMGIIIGIVFFNYGTFTSRSLVRVRATDLGEYIRFAQEQAGAAESFSTNTALPTEGFQVVRLKVREGVLKSVRLEKAPGAFTSFTEGSNFALGRDSIVPGSRQVALETSERYFIDVCFIDEGNSPQYTREQVTLQGDTGCATNSMLCNEPNPVVIGYSAAQIKRNNFDAHFSVEQPSREVHTNIIPVTVSGDKETYQYADTKPNGATSRMSEKYEGVRIVFITEEGYRQSIDVFQTGLVGFRATDSRDGCQ